MTRPEYAEFLGYKNIETGIRQIHRWESGDVPRTAKALSRLCGATGRRAAFFRGDADEAPAPEIMRAVYEALGEALLIAAELAADREKVA
jgi:hypothetical protein